MGETVELLTDRPSDGVLRLRLNRPDRLNAVDMSIVNSLLTAFDAVDARAIVLGSTTRRAFCSGADLDLEDEERARVSDKLYELYEKMVRLPVPIVAAIEGHAVGAGAQLAVAADLRVAGPEAKIRVPGPGHGLAVASWGLPSLVGRGRAMDLCLTMRAIDAQEALTIGLVDRVEEDPGGAAVSLASSFAELDTAAAGRVKRMVAGASGYLEALREERAGNRETWSGSVAALSSQPGKGGN
jgi:enoyl-CoA hydratase/carnithine racemase